MRVHLEDVQARVPSIGGEGVTVSAETNHDEVLDVAKFSGCLCCIACFEGGDDLVFRADVEVCFMTLTPRRYQSAGVGYVRHLRGLKVFDPESVGARLQYSGSFQANDYALGDRVRVFEDKSIRYECLFNVKILVASIQLGLAIRLGTGNRTLP